MAKFDKVIPPGQTGRIIAKLNTKSYKGKLSKSVTVISNDPERSTLKLMISCSVMGIKVYPFSRVYFNARVGESQTKELTIQTIGEGPLTMTVEASNPYFKIDLERLTDGPKPVNSADYWDQYKLHVTLPKGFPEGRISETLTLKSNSAYEPTVSIPVSGRIFPSINVNPRSVVMTPKAGSKAPAAIITVSQASGATLKVSKVMATPPELEARLRPAETRNLFYVDLGWSDSQKKGTHNGTVTIYTNDFFKPIINVPVKVVVN